MLSVIDANKFAALIEMSERINSHYADRKSLLTHIIESATHLCDGEASSLLLVDPHTDTLYFEIALGEKGPEVSRFSLKKGEGIAGWVVDNNTSLIINDVENDPRFSSKISQSTGYQTYTMLAVPMRIKTRCVGVIEILNKKNKGKFNQEDLSWLEIFANQAALAIQNAESYEKVSQKLALLEEQMSLSSFARPLIGSSKSMLELQGVAKKIASSDATVLITGESGTGKELFAELIHENSARSNKPFIRVNSAAIPENLLESELFGHVKGAFTDAQNNRVGRFELADGGTIFLDEIGDMSLSVQAKLLRVLQERSFERLGSSETIQVDVRIIAATNRDIGQMAKEGLFRSDLFYRLNVIPLHVPPLRERKEDISELTEHFLEKFCIKNNKKLISISPSALRALEDYAWPGNVRELENILERACIISEGKTIAIDDLYLKNIQDAHSNKADGHATLKDAINAFKRSHIKEVLNACEGNQTLAAEKLGIQRTYLSKLIGELELREKGD